MARIGDVDEDGIVVGFVDREGNGWRDRKERDCAITGGRWDEAYVAHLRGQRRMPSMWAFAVRYCSRPWHWRSAVVECREDKAFRHWSRALFVERLSDG